MTGWKTWTAGISSILAGLAMIGQALAGEGDGDFNNGIQMIIAGLAIVGIGHKIEKAG